jgi:hypothetical protein
VSIPYPKGPIPIPILLLIFFGYIPRLQIGIRSYKEVTVRLQRKSSNFNKVTEVTGLAGTPALVYENVREYSINAERIFLYRRVYPLKPVTIVTLLIFMNLGCNYYVTSL